MVIDNSGRGERAYDIYSLLLKERIVFLGTPITDQVANLIVAQLLYLNGEDPNQPINMYINSPGGSIYAGLAIYDTMQMIPAPVATYAVGVTASMGTVLLAAGAKGKRYALPHATIHMHPASSGAQGYTEDVRIAFREQERVQTQLFHLVGKHTGHDWKEIEEDVHPRPLYERPGSQGLWPGGRRAGRHQRPRRDQQGRPDQVFNEPFRQRRPTGSDAVNCPCGRACAATT